LGKRKRTATARGEIKGFEMLGSRAGGKVGETVTIGGFVT